MVEFVQEINPKRWSVKTGHFMGTDSQLISATAIIKKKIAKTSNDTLKKKEKKIRSTQMSNIPKLLIWVMSSCICAVEDLPTADTFSGNHACQYRTSNLPSSTCLTTPTPCKLMTLKNTYLNAMEIYTKLSFINTLTNIINVKKPSKKKEYRWTCWSLFGDCQLKSGQWICMANEKEEKNEIANKHIKRCSNSRTKSSSLVCMWFCIICRRP